MIKAYKLIMDSKHNPLSRIPDNNTENAWQSLDAEYNYSYEYQWG